MLSRFDNKSSKESESMRFKEKSKSSQSSLTGIGKKMSDF